MTAENVFPPIPSELLMPFAGFSAARGTLGLPGAILAGVDGSVSAVRTLIAGPAGVARMPLPRLLAYSAAGSVLWMGALAGLGYALGADHGRVAQDIGPATNVLVGLLVLGYLHRVARWHPDAPAAPAADARERRRREA